MKALLRASACWVALLMLLAGCSTRAPRTALPPALSDPQAIDAAGRIQSQREQWLGEHPRWSFEGRVAINNAGKGGNGRIDWQQDGAGYRVSLSAPVTRQSWRLIGDTQSGAGTLEGLDGGPRQGEDAEALLLNATGWDIPVNALARWVVGLEAGNFPLDVRTFSPEGHLQTLEQGGWHIDYAQWAEAMGTQPALPRRIEARRGQATVRLIVDRWDFGAP